MWLLVFLFAAGPIQARGMCPNRCKCNDNSLQVSCSDAALEVVPIQLNPATRHIDLSGNKISELHFTFSFYSNLESLDLSANKILTLGSGNFDSQRYLKQFNLSSNEIETISKDSLKGLHALLELDLSYNKIEDIRTHAFRELHSLRVLKLEGNSLMRLEEGLFKPTKNLRELLLDDNQLMEVPIQAIADASSLQQLSLSQNLIESVEEEMPMLPELQVLKLNKNIISDIKQGAFAGLPSLNFLDLSDNNFTAVPTDSLCKLSNLTELRFGGNVIESIAPVAFRGLFHLKKLNIDRQDMLEKIDARAFVDNINLERLRMDGNIAVEQLPPRLFHGNPKLAHISVRNNRLSKVDASHFPLDQLKSLRLGGNPLQCNCSLLWLWRLGKEQGKVLLNDTEPAKLTLDVEHVICSGPQPLEGHVLLEVKESDIGCSQDWKTVLTAGLFASFILLAAGGVIYYGHVKSRNRRQRPSRRDLPPCPNGAGLPMGMTFDDGRSGKCIVGVGPQIIHEYETLPPWNPYAKPAMPFGPYEPHLSMKPHIVYV